MLYSEKRYQEIIDLVTAYLKRRGDDGDVSKAAYWIGKTKLDQGLIHEAISAYREAIIQYGNNILQDGVDLIITELYNVSRRLEKNAREQLKEQLQKDVEAADNMTLKLRLRVLLSKMNGTELELGKVLIAELPDLTQAPPPVLAVICKASFAQGDYSRSGEILNIFKNHFEDSDFTRDAYKLRGYDLYNAGDLDGAMEIVKDVQALYGTQPDVAWAQLMKGRIQLKLKDFDSARQTFRDLLSVREWRGEAYAEATLELGKVEEAAGDLKQAFAWYQRAYFQYKGYANGVFAAEGYLASARCLQALGQENDVRNTYRAMLFDKYVNQLPQADVARKTLGPAEVEEINLMLTNGVQPNLTESVGAEGAK